MAATKNLPAIDFRRVPAEEMIIGLEVTHLPPREGMRAFLDACRATGVNLREQTHSKPKAERDFWATTTTEPTDI